jgi:alanyl-tRNA synthetase
MEHVGDLSECYFFLVTRLSKSGSEYEVDFVVGRQAKEMSQLISKKLMRVCAELGANINTLENTAAKLKAENDHSRGKLRSLTLEMLKAMNPVGLGSYSMLRGEFANLDDDQILEFAGQKIRDEKTLVLIANADSETAKIVFARNEALSEVDCNAIFKRVVGEQGRGGGRAHFVTGEVKADAVTRMINDMAEQITKHS